jgi:hypothetical protein
MLVSYARVIRFMDTLSMTVPDELDCDGCFELIAEFADAEKRGVELSESMQLVRTHLQQCPCCAYEYEALIEAVMAAED